jgi:DNA polymerase-3 subunit beta
MSGPAGEGEVELEVGGEGKDVTVLLNIQYLMEGVQHIGTSEVEIWFGSESDPVVVRPIGSKRSYTYVIMPIQA